jgi:ankyrin repeat protein
VLLASGAVRSLKVVDSDGQHVLNLAVRNKQDAVVQVGLLLLLLLLLLFIKRCVLQQCMSEAVFWRQLPLVPDQHCRRHTSLLLLRLLPPLLLLQALLRLDPELAVLPDMTANTPLHWACETGNSQLVQQLLPLKPELNMQNLNQNEYSAGGRVA